MIPRKIHAFWFGRNPKPALVRKCQDTWRRVLPDYEIVEWNEDTFDVNASAFTRRAFAEKKFAFVSDYARLAILLKHGGIYLDVDVELKRSFDPLLGARAFMGFMYDCNLGTAVIGAEPNHPLIRDLLAEYDTREDLSVPNNDLFTNFMLQRHPGFRLDNSLQRFAEVVAYPKEYFEFPLLWGQGGFSVHHFLGSWWRSDSVSERLKEMLKRVSGRTGYWALRQLAHRRALRDSPFRERYLADKHARRVPRGSEH